MYGQFSLATGVSSLLPTATRVLDVLLYKKLLMFTALRVQLVILASAFVAGSTLFWVSCMPHVALHAQLFVKVGARLRALWFRTHCLGYGPSVMVWGQRIWETEIPQFGPRAKPWYGVWCPARSQLFVKMGARAPVPYGVGATVSDILIIIIIIIIIIINILTWPK